MPKLGVFSSIETLSFIRFSAMDKILDDLHGPVSDELFLVITVAMALSTMSEIRDPDDDDEIRTGDTENNDLGIIRGRVSGIPIIAFEALSSAVAVVFKVQFIAIVSVFFEKQKKSAPKDNPNRSVESFSKEMK